MFETDLFNCSSNFPFHEQFRRIHYHILWSSDSALDWKPFLTKEDAMEVAGLIKKPNESYIVVERDGECERCEEFKSKAIAAQYVTS